MLLTGTHVRKQAVGGITPSYSPPSRAAPIIPQNLPIIFLRVSGKSSQLFLKTKPIILDNNLTLSLAKNPLLGEQMNTMNK